MDLFKGKKILYVHGFASSGQSGTVTRIQENLPDATVIAPDLPLHPEEAMELLHKTLDEEHPDLIIGTSMGGMFTEMLYGYDRIIVNPAFKMGETMVSHNMVGAQTVSNPRKDGVQDFIVTKALVKEYKDITEKCFSGVTDEERDVHVIGMFGDEDNLVNSYDIFCEHYPTAIKFHGEHRMNDRSFSESVLPVIRWIDDRQEERERPVVFISFDTLMDDYKKPRSSSQKAIRRLIELYNVYFVAGANNHSVGYMDEINAWTQEYINVPAYRHILYTDHPQLLMGDYYISSLPSSENFMGTLIKFGSPTFKTWEEIIEYFDMLGGQ